jgi:polyisoprenyl-phosphate glycosyltransferase
VTVCCIVPAYNEEKRIGGVLEVLAESPLLDQIVVVNDGSTDDTSEIVGRFNRVTLIEQVNKGKGDALLAGVRVSKHPLLVFCDADLEGLKQEHLVQIIEPVRSGEFRLVVGSQEFSGGKPLTPNDTSSKKSTISSCWNLGEKK